MNDSANRILLKTSELETHPTILGLPCWIAKIRLIVPKRFADLDYDQTQARRLEDRSALSARIYLSEYVPPTCPGRAS